MKELTLEILRGAGKTYRGVTIAELILSIPFLLGMGVAFPPLILIFLLLFVFLPKFRKYTKEALWGTMDALGVSKRKKEDRFYLVRRVSTEKSVDTDGDSDAYYTHLGEYKLAAFEMQDVLAHYGRNEVGKEYFLQFYEGDTKPCMAYPCVDWYLGEELQKYLRE